MTRELALVADLHGNLPATEALDRDLRRRGIDAKTQSAIVPVIVGDERRAVGMSARLLDAGFLVPAIRYPTVARGAARLRCAVMSAHTHGQLAAAAEAIAAAARA